MVYAIFVCPECGVFNIIWYNGPTSLECPHCESMMDNEGLVSQATMESWLKEHKEMMGE
jgi:hypothetical protein